VWQYLPCITKVWFSDVAHFPSFSTVSAHWRHLGGLSEYPLPTPWQLFNAGTINVRFVS
jgi:hypothetical protein